MRRLALVLLSAVFAFAVAPFDARGQESKNPPPKEEEPPRLATDDEAEAAVAAFKRSMTSNLVSVQKEAIREVSRVRHEKVIRALAPYLGHPSDEIVFNASLALGRLDHPKSAEVLTGAVGGLLKRPVAAAAVLDAIGQLSYDSSLSVLHRMLDRAGDADTRRVLQDVLKALALTGHPSSVDPLIEFYRRIGGMMGGFRGGEGSGFRLRRACQAALKAVTGGDEETGDEWARWWKSSRDGLVAEAADTWRCKITWERFEGPHGKPATCKHASEKGHNGCAARVRTRLVPLRQELIDQIEGKEPKEGGKEGEGKDKDKEKDKEKSGDEKK